jgi:LacI family transcriptional regulator
MNKIRLKDVAAQAGVAVNTASTILNRRPNSWASKETEERVFAAAAQLGYKPNRAAQALRFGRFHALGLIIADLHNPYYTAFADAMEEAAGARGYDVLIETWRNDLARERHLLEELSNRQVDGIAAFLSDPETHRDFLSGQAAQGTAFVVLGTTGEPQAPVDAVLADFERGLHEAVDILIGLGHRRFAFINALAAGQFGGRRLELFRRLLADKGIASSDVTDVDCSHTIASACAAATTLLQRPASARPTAIMALNDLSAIATMRAAAEQGLSVPGDLSVIGVDDIPLGSFLPVTLSTIAQPIAEMARRTTDLLIQRVEDKAPGIIPEKIVFPTAFLRRESIGPARG